MASNVEFVQSVCERLTSVGEVRYRKMFGEYMIYVDDRPVLMVCDNRVFAKMRPELAGLAENLEIDLPYAGAKPHYVLDGEDGALCAEIVKILLPLTPVPKKKKKQ